MRSFLFALFVTVFSSQTFAETRGVCSGKYQGKSVVLSGGMENIADIKTGKGSVTVDGREVAEFVGADAKINPIFLTLKIQNSRSEVLEGRIVDLKTLEGIITKLSIPGFGIDFKNVKVTCVEVK